MFLLYPQNLTAEILDGIFKSCYSEEGCRRREREELIIMHWRDYLQECQGVSYLPLPSHLANTGSCFNDIGDQQCGDNSEVYYTYCHLTVIKREKKPLALEDCIVIIVSILYPSYIFNLFAFS